MDLSQNPTGPVAKPEGSIIQETESASVTLTTRQVKKFILVIGIAILIVVLATVLSSSANGSSSRNRSYDNLRWNELQWVKSHNSYHRRMDSKPIPDSAAAHGPNVTEMLNAGVRALEFDIQYPIQNNFTVSHIRVFDNKSSCQTLRVCLNEVDMWMQSHSTEGPVFMHIDAKANSPALSDKEWRLYDSIIVDIFGDKIVKPSSVLQPSGPPNWPTLLSTQNKVAFILNSEYPSYGSLSDVDLSFAFNAAGQNKSFTSTSHFPQGELERDSGYIVRFRADATYLPAEEWSDPVIECNEDILQAWFTVFDRNSDNQVNLNEIMDYVDAAIGSEKAVEIDAEARLQLIIEHCGLAQQGSYIILTDMVCLDSLVDAEAKIFYNLDDFQTFEQVSYRRNSAIRKGMHMIDTDWVVKPSWALPQNTIEDVYWVQLDSMFVCNPVTSLISFPTCSVPTRFVALDDPGPRNTSNCLS